jgi:D-alanyl-D-alanine carboxypeptidase
MRFASGLGFLLWAALPIAAQQTVTHPAKKMAASAARTAKRADEVRFESRVSAALDAAGAEKSFWGILIADRDTGETVYELNAEKFFTPASNAKIFTSSLAFATLAGRRSGVGRTRRPGPFQSRFSLRRESGA